MVVPALFLKFAYDKAFNQGIYDVAYVNMSILGIFGVDEIMLASKALTKVPKMKSLLKWMRRGKTTNNVERAFNHIATSGAIVTNNATHGTFLIGSYPTDLQHILNELNYPKILEVDFASPPLGQKFNLLNISEEQYNYWAANGGFFTKVNGPWIDAAVTQSADIIVVSDFIQLYNSPGVLSGFGKEIHRLEWKHGYRFDPTTKMMVPPNKAQGLPAKTLQSEYTHN